MRSASKQRAPSGPPAAARQKGQRVCSRGHGPYQGAECNVCKRVRQLAACVATLASIGVRLKGHDLDEIQIELFQASATLSSIAHSLEVPGVFLPRLNARRQNAAVRNWIQTPEGRAWAGVIARQRELLRLMARAGCSLQEAREHRQRNERYCEVHGWYSAALCLKCKRARSVARRGRRDEHEES